MAEAANDGDPHPSITSIPHPDEMSGKAELLSHVLSNKHTDTLVQNYAKIVDTLQHVEHIVTNLQSEDCITKDQSEAILAKDTERHKIRHMLQTLLSRSEGAFYIFLQLLRDTQNTQELYNLLKDEGTPDTDTKIHLPPLYGESQRYQEQLILFHREKLSSVAKSRPKCYDAKNHISLTVYSGQLELHGARIGHREYMIRPRARLLNSIDPDYLFSSKNINDTTSDPRTVLMIGVPGIGKTATCYFFLQQLIDHKLFKDTFLFVFFIKLKEIELLPSQITFQDLLLNFHGPTIQSQEIRCILWQYILRHQEYALFLLDGYDEIHGLGTSYSANFDVTFTSLDKPTRPQILVNNLIKKNILPRSKVLLTSRPHCVQQLRDSIDRLVELGGLDEVKLDSLVSKDLEEQPILKQSVCEHVREHDVLRSMCYVPAYATGFLDFVKWRHHGLEDSCLQAARMPQTLAALLLTLVIMLLHKSDRELTRHYQDLQEAEILDRKSGTLQKLAQLAFNGLLSQNTTKQLYTEDDTRELGLTEGELQCGIVTSYVSAVSESFLPIFKRTFSFPHLILQEWLCALRLLKVPLSDILRIIHENNGERDVILLLLLGMFGDKFCQTLMPRVYPDVETSSWEENAQKIVRAICRSPRNRMFGCTSFAIMALHESQQLQLANDILPFVSNVFGELDISPMSPADCMSLSSFLSHLDVELPNIWLTGGYIGNEGLRELLRDPGSSRYHGLALEPDKIGTEHYAILSQALDQQNNGVHHLCLRGKEPIVENNLCKLSFKDNRSLFWLGLFGRLANYHSIKVVCNSLQQFTSLDTLVLSDNPIGQLPGEESNLKHIQNLHSLRYLIIRKCGLSYLDVSQILPMVESGQLQWLDLSGNAIGDQGVKPLSCSLTSDQCKLIGIRLMQCRIGPTGCSILFNKLKNQSTVKILNLSQNLIGRDSSSLLDLVYANRVIEELYIQRCSVSDVSAHSIFSILRQVPTALTCITLSENTINKNKAFAKLTKLLKSGFNLQSLYLADCGLSSDNIVDLSKSLQQNCRMKHLSIASNPGVSFRAIAKLLTRSKLQYLNISDCDPRAGGEEFKLIAKALCKNQHLMELCIGNQRKPSCRESGMCQFFLGLLKYPQTGPLCRVWVLESSRPDHSKMHLIEESLERTCFLHVTHNSIIVDTYTERNWAAVPEEKRQWLLYD